MKIKLSNGHLICPASELDTVSDLYLADDKIIAIGNAPDGFVPDQIITLHNQIITPGFIDLCAYIGDLQHSPRPNLYSEAYAAASGGFTSICLNPCEALALDEPAHFDFLSQRETTLRQIDLFPIGALTQQQQGEQLTQLQTFYSLGCRLIHAGSKIYDTHRLRLCFDYAANANLTIIVSPQDPWLHNAGVMHEGEISLRLGVAGIPACSETIAMSRYIYLSQCTGARIHFDKITTEAGVDLVAAAKANGVSVTASTSPMYLWFTDMDLSTYNPNFHLDPPLRETRDNVALLKGIRDGTIDALVSDHQPYSFDEKLAPLQNAKPGVANFQTTLALALRLQTMGMTLAAILRLLNAHPAQILHRSDRGRIALDAPANLCIFSPNKPWTLNKENWTSQGMNTPFWQWEFLGQVDYTFYNGQLIYQAQESV